MNWFGLVPGTEVNLFRSLADNSANGTQTPLATWRKEHRYYKINFKKLVNNKNHKATTTNFKEGENVISRVATL